MYICVELPEDYDSAVRMEKSFPGRKVLIMY